jgi:GNAT superfamily N-acetyltransferase
VRAIVVRTTLRPGDVDAIVRLHGSIYSREFGFDASFERYVAAPLAAFAERIGPRERIWIAEHEDRIVGSVAIVAGSDDVAQLRWFLVDPASRGDGLGTSLLHDAVAFCRSAGYASVVLWTVSALRAAARLYVAAGFHRSEEKPGRRWGVDVVEEKYEMALL